MESACSRIPSSSFDGADERINSRGLGHGCSFNSLRVHAYERFRERYQECIRMLNGLERTLERQLSERDRRWPERKGPENSELSLEEDSDEYHTESPPVYRRIPFLFTPDS